MDTIFISNHIVGDTIKATFYFTTGSKFKLFQVHPGCQCTAPVFPSDTLIPNKIDSIVLIVYTQFVHIGEFNKYAIILNPIQEKSIYLIGNLNPALAVKPKLYVYNNKISKQLN